jgi:purine catabolism regulator
VDPRPPGAAPDGSVALLQSALVIAQSGKQRGHPPTVRDVLELDLIQEAGGHLIAGKGSLGREIKWGHAGEIPDIANYLRGGELLMTAGTGIGDRPAQMRRYVEALSAAGVSALMLELGRAFTSPPEELRERAEELDLPLIILERDVPFAEVTRKVHEMIIGQQYELIELADETARELSALLLAGGHLSEVVHWTAEWMGNPVVLEDGARQVVEYAGTRGFDETLADWRHHARSDHDADPDNSGPAHSSADPPCWWTVVTVRGAAWGRLHALEHHSRLDPVDRIVLERAASAIGLALLSDQDRVISADHARAELLGDLSRRAPADQAEFLRRARSLGADLSDRSLAVIAFDASLATKASRWARALRAAADELGAAFLQAAQNDRGYLLVGLKRQADSDTALRSFAERVAGLIDQPVPVGVSRMTTLATVPRAFYEADECLRYARLARIIGVQCFGSLGLHALLLALGERDELATFVETELGPLLEHDARSSQQLLPTLRALIECDGNKVHAAAELHIERRSVYYRLSRLEKVLGRSLSPHDTRLSLAVALRALDLAEDRSRNGRLAGPVEASRAR